MGLCSISCCEPETEGGMEGGWDSELLSWSLAVPIRPNVRMEQSSSRRRMIPLS